MSKRIKGMIAGIAALLVVVIAVTTVLLLPPDDGDGDETVTTTTTKTPAIEIVNKENANVKQIVTRLDVQNDTDTFSVITVDSGSMVVERYADVPADTTAINALCQSMTLLTALAAPPANEDDSAYGFDKPTARVTATYHDGTTATVVFGAASKGTAGYYCRREGDNTLYIVDSTVAESFDIDAKALIGKLLIAPPSKNKDDESGAAGLLDLWLTGSCRDQAIEITTDTDGKYAGMTYVSTYVITKPYLRSVDSDLFNTMASQMTYLSAVGVEKVHPTVEDLTTYGLDDPYSVGAFTLSVMSTASADEGGTTTSHYNDREHMVILGNKDENGNYYALVDQYDLIYILSPASVPWAELTYYDVTNKLLFMKDITSVDSITVTKNGDATTFALAHHPLKETRDEQMVVTAGDKTYSTAEFRILYQLMIGVHRVGEKEGDATAAGDPVLRFDMTFNDGTAPMSLSLYPMTASRYLCVTQDGEQTAVSISDVEEFVRQYENYLTGAPVTSPY